MKDAITVKHWGIWPITRRRYLIALGIQVLVLACLLAEWLLMPRPLPELAPGEDRVTVLLFGLVANIGWILLFMTAMTAVDAGLMLLRFHQKNNRGAIP